MHKAEESEIKLPIFTGSQKQQESRKTSTSVSLTMLKPLTVWIITNCGKLLKRWEYQTILPVSWETCMRVKKQQLEPYIEQPTGSKLRKQYERLFIVTLFNLQSTIMWNVRLNELQAGIKIARRNINNLRYMDNTTLMAERKRNWRVSWWGWRRRVIELA